ncbi:hypothetical protein [uncultured Prevotella sp.]|uniref:hypothetical protein n=1 Tax=uncultured Prevotella sp. TaxID=159272 RepID=UPI0027E2A185|nr:hypothetical protein [uncultured Prevotella sp.]
MSARQVPTMRWWSESWLTPAFAAVPLSGVYHAVAYAERAVAVVAAVLYGAAVGVFAVLADYGVGRDVTARCQ